MELLLFLLALAIALAAASAARNSPSARGRRGERRLSRRIRRKLSAEDYIDLHDLILPTPDGTTQIDHVLVSPFGIFVIETKNMSGRIYGRAQDRTWTQTFRRGQKFRMQNPLRQNFKHVKAVQQLIPLPPGVIHNVVVFVGESRMATEVPPNVTSLRTCMRYIRSFREEVIPRSKLPGIARTLSEACRNLDDTAARTHVASLKRNAEQPICPRCGKPMALRTAQRGRNAGGKFWGCTGYPACRATRAMAKKR